MSDLWCVNIEGPDDIHACASKQQAEGLAARLNDHFGPQAQKDDILFNAVVVPWPYSPEKHALDYAKTLSGWGSFVPDVSP